jgi:hypothetical protein
VIVIKEWPSPRNIFEVRIFHGLASFYIKFIRKFSGICAPMLDTVKKKHKSFNWTEEAGKSFKVLKEKITEQPILVKVKTQAWRQRNIAFKVKTQAWRQRNIAFKVKTQAWRQRSDI